MNSTETDNRTDNEKDALETRTARQMYAPDGNINEVPVFVPGDDQIYAMSRTHRKQYEDSAGNVYRLVSPQEMLEHLRAMRERSFMKYYGDLRKVDLTISDEYTAEDAWAHTDARTIINARHRRPYHTLKHEVEHVIADIFGYSQDEHWINFRAHDPSRDEIRKNVVVRGDYN